MANEEKKAVTPKTAVQKKPDEKPGMFKRLGKWFREMRSELKKVVWPTPKQTVNNTVAALVVMVISAIVIWGFDEIAQMIVKAVISIAG